MKVGMMFGVSCECAQHIYVPYVANYSRWKLMRYAELNCNLLDNYCG